MFYSGQEDSNLRPHGPEPCALAKLSYAPFFKRLLLETKALSTAIKSTSFRLFNVCSTPILSLLIPARIPQSFQLGSILQIGETGLCSRHAKNRIV